MIHVLASESYADLMGSSAHWLFELTLEGLTGLVTFPLGVLYQRWHDKRHHSHDNVALVNPHTERPNPFVFKEGDHVSVYAPSKSLHAKTGFVSYVYATNDTVSVFMTASGKTINFPKFELRHVSVNP